MSVELLGVVAVGIASVALVVMAAKLTADLKTRCPVCGNQVDLGAERVSDGGLCPIVEQAYLCPVCGRTGHVLHTSSCWDT